jgi:hypothetical protein
MSGRPIDDGTVVSVKKGRYPLMTQVAVGSCESWGVIWIAPRFRDVTGRFADRQDAYELAMADWPAYVAARDNPFVLDE